MGLLRIIGGRGLEIFILNLGLMFRTEVVWQTREEEGLVLRLEGRGGVRICILKASAVRERIYGYGLAEEHIWR